MRTDLTFTIIKPSAIRKNFTGPIIEMFNRNGFKIVAMKMVHLSPDKARILYEVHKERPFFNDLLAYMTEDRIIVAALQKENAVADFRELIGKTDPNEAAFGTIRKMFAESHKINAVHGSDSNENAEREIGLFFSEDEIFLKN
ncbi:MAG: nucleoside-diphosphate kinase [Prolixibacteraceae bacterium]|nr:nucleoside-diphosphate kinase [Prolixibacteraceae bacterium]